MTLIKYIYTFKLFLLSRIYHFEKWHWKNNLESVKYKKVVINKINELSVKTVIEVGCGLGEILGNLNAKHVIGYDTSKEVIVAGKFLYKKVQFNTSDLNYQPIKSDLFITLNWIHNIESTELENLLKPHIETSTFFICDSAKGPGYKFKHSFENMFQSNLVDKQIIFSDSSREIYLFRIQK